MPFCDGALEVRRDAHAVLAQRQNRHDVTGLNQTGDVIPAADIQVAVAANQRGVRVGTGRIRDLQQVKAFGRLREGRAVNAGRGQHRNGNLKRMILDVSLELRPVAHAELLHRDLGSNDGVDGVNQNVFALELGLEVHRGVAQHVLNIQGLGAEHKGVAVSRLLVGVLNAVDAGTAFHVHNLNRNAQDILEQRGHRAQGGVSAAADAPRANEVDLALEP